MSFLLCLYFREELVSSRVLFSPLCSGKLFLWKWTGLAGPLIPLCDSISFIKLWHLTCYKGIENSTIWAFQSAGFLLKNRGMYLKATFRSTCLSGLHFNKFFLKAYHLFTNVGKKWTIVSLYPSKYYLKHTKYSHDWQKESIIISGWHVKIAQAWASTPAIERTKQLGESQCFFPAQKVVAVLPPLHHVGRSEATQTFPWPETSWLHLHQGRLISFYWLQEMAVNWVNK